MSQRWSIPARSMALILHPDDPPLDWPRVLIFFSPLDQLWFSWRLLFFGYDPGSSNLKRFSCRTSEVVGRSVADVTDIYYYIRTLTSTDEGNPYRELVYHTHTPHTTSFQWRARTLSTTFCIFLPSKEDGGFGGSEKSWKFESEVWNGWIVSQLALYSVLRLQTSHRPCTNFGDKD